MSIDTLSPAYVSTLWSHLRDRNKTRAETAEAFLAEAENLNPTDMILACLDRTGPEWDAILSALMNRPMYKCAPGETAFPLKDVRGKVLPSPVGTRFGVAASPPEPRPEPRVRVQKRKADPRIVTRLSANPKKVGSKSYDRYALYHVGITVDEFIAKGGLREDITYDVRHGFIELGYAP